MLSRLRWWLVKRLVGRRFVLMNARVINARLVITDGQVEGLVCNNLFKITDEQGIEPQITADSCEVMWVASKYNGGA